MRLGDSAPDLTLPDTDGQDHGLAAGGVTAVVFTCNHCPYALAWQDRIADVARDYADRGVRVLAVNPNDSDRYPADSFEAMKERVERRAAGRCPTSATRASRRRARSTPRRRRTCSYSTRRAVSATGADSTTAIRRRTQPGSVPPSTPCWRARSPRRAETEPVGCSIKWKP